MAAQQKEKTLNDLFLETLKDVYVSTSGASVGG